METRTKNGSATLTAATQKPVFRNRPTNHSNNGIFVAYQ